MVILDPVVLQMLTSKGQCSKTVSSDWLLGDLRNGLCARLSLPPDYVFVNSVTNEAVEDSTTVGEYSSVYGTVIKLQMNSIPSATEWIKSKRLLQPSIFSEGTVQTTSQKKSGTTLELRLPKPVGLVNSGNTCYFNSILQCLCRITLLNTFVLSPGFPMSVNETNPSGSGGVIAKEYRQFIESMGSPQNNAPRDARLLQRAIARTYNQFANVEQHDAQEMMGALLDGLHEDLIRTDLQSLKSVPTSIIADLFYGTLMSRVGCRKCGASEDVFDPFLFMSLPIPGPDSSMASVPLAKCIERFLNCEVLEESEKWFCPKCQMNVAATKTTTLYRAPKILILHLKRFCASTGIARKINTTVEYPDQLEIAAFSSEAAGCYALVGVVMHSGGLSFGHYTAAAIDQASEKWYLFNDAFVSAGSSKLAHSSRAYLLLYQNIDS
jgi:ubiquitin carboxyl-terminal hydrolase 8